MTRKSARKYKKKAIRKAERYAHSIMQPLTVTFHAGLSNRWLSYGREPHIDIKITKQQNKQVFRITIADSRGPFNSHSSRNIIFTDLDKWWTYTKTSLKLTYTEKKYITDKLSEWSKETVED